METFGYHSVMEVLASVLVNNVWVTGSGKTAVEVLEKCVAVLQGRITTTLLNATYLEVHGNELARAVDTNAGPHIIVAAFRGKFFTRLLALLGSLGSAQFNAGQVLQVNKVASISAILVGMLLYAQADLKDLADAMMQAMDAWFSFATTLKASSSDTTMGEYWAMVEEQRQKFEQWKQNQEQENQQAGNQEWGKLLSWFTSSS